MLFCYSWLSLPVTVARKRLDACCFIFAVLDLVNLGATERLQVHAVDCGDAGENEGHSTISSDPDLLKIDLGNRLHQV
ncbi:hypothetical protein BDW75DRAFT_207054 [Aspergillus navahoensis]